MGETCEGEIVNDQLLEILRVYAGNRIRLRDDLTLYHDLELSGEDAWEFLADVEREFRVSFKCFDFSAYFPHAGEDLYYKIGKIFGFKATKFRRFTIGHLRRVVRSGEWTEPA